VASTGVVGFHLTPPVWVGDTLPDRNAEITLKELQTEVYRRDLAVGIRARVLHSGVFIFDFSAWPRNQDFPTKPNDWPEYDEAVSVVALRVRIINVYLACLYSALQAVQDADHEKMIVTPPDLNPYTQFAPPPEGIDDLFVLGLTRRTQAGTFSLGIESNLRHTFQQDITQATLVKSFEMLEELLGLNSDDALLFSEMLLRSRKAYEDLDYNLCLILAWTMTEKMLFLFWDRYIAANRTRTIDGMTIPFITNSRIETLNNTTNFTASTVAETLSLLDVLPFDLYMRMVDVRKRRNKWVHELQPVSRVDAETAVKLAANMLKSAEGIDLPARLRVSVSFG